MIDSNRYFNHLTPEEIVNNISEDSILCIPIGSTEQHGSHLPLNTDTVLAGSFAKRLVAEYHQKYDLWLLPAFEYGLSSEHAWARGTISISVELYVRLFHELVKGLIRAQSARNIILVNGHGGNRGVLEALIQEFRDWYSIVAIVLHPSALSQVKSESKFAEVHGGKSETSKMLAVAPGLVNMNLIPLPLEQGDQCQASYRILNRGVTWPWYSNDIGIGRDGVIGDAALASVELGNKIIESAVRKAEEVIVSLIEFGKTIRKK